MDLRIFTEPQQGATYDTLLRMATTAEELGFDAFFRSDHYIHFDGDGLPGPSDAWLTLGALARETSRIRLGTLVSPVTFRWPGQLAIEVAQVDAMSSGRVELGLGAGWNDAEHAANAIPFPSTGTRFEMLEDQLAIISGMWGTPVGETFSYEGRQQSVSNSPGLPKPVQHESHSSGPPIVMGGWGAKRTPRLAAKYAAEYNLPFSPVVNVCRRSSTSSVPHARRSDATPARSPCRLRSSPVVARTRTSSSGVQRPSGRTRTACGRTNSAAPSTRLQLASAAYRDGGAQRLYLQVLDLHDLEHVHLLAKDPPRPLTDRADRARRRRAAQRSVKRRYASWRGKPRRRLRGCPDHDLGRGCGRRRRVPHGRRCGLLAMKHGPTVAIRRDITAAVR